MDLDPAPVRAGSISHAHTDSWRVFRAPGDRSSLGRHGEEKRLLRDLCDHS